MNETTRTAPVPKVITFHNSPRLSEIFLLLRINSARDFTRAEICAELGYKKTAHMIRLIERGRELHYYGRDVKWNDDQVMFYVYRAGCLPF